MPQGRPEQYDLSPMDEIHLSDLQVKESELDETMTMQDENTDPKPPIAAEEPVTNDNGDTVAVDPSVDDALDFRL